MRMQMNGRNQVERQVRWRDEFDYMEGLLLYLLLKSAAMLKDVVPFGEIVLNMRQYVRSIHLLRRGLWFYYLKKRDLNSYSWIHHLIKRQEKLGLITAERLPCVFLFSMSGVEESGNTRMLAETEEASTAKEQSKNRQNLFLLTASEAVVEDS
ncbi:hypothetical protein LCM00_15185 [Bacillus infantis]|uniref:hypothetical protein n=1 Tax=Bacillus infantis TaxID=324767 RepID=UPI001CD41CA6|nr:hypothetical protein [Bacillus infantis]MCA1040858.1 hypothetical protein [Bacillus infantis]